MTSQKDQIQRLITEIEAALAKPASRLPLGLSGETAQQRQLLNKLYDYLRSLGQAFESPGGWGPIDPRTGQLVSPPALSPDVEESAAHVLQGLLLEMRYLKENSLKPMRQELELLQQRRDSLQAEVNVLEAQRGADPLQSEQQIDAFLETLMQRLQQQLSAQMAQNFATMEAATVEKLSASAEDNPVPLLPEQRLAQVQLLQAQSDQLLLRLDSTLTAVFDSLQKSVDSYRESLEEGLDQMHGLGRQGEVIFHAFINHLAQQLGQDASSYLAEELGPALQQVRLQEPEAVADVELEAAQLDELNQALEDLSLEGDAGDSGIADDAGIEIDPDLALFDLEQLEDAIASTEALDLEALDMDGESTVIQPTDELETLDNLPLDDLPLDDLPLDDTTEDITLIQTDDPELTQPASDPQATSAAVDPATDSDSEPATLPLNTSLGSIDESLDLLAMGLDADESATLDQRNDDFNQDLLAQIATEGDLFNFDLDLEPGEPTRESDSDLLEGAQLPGNSIDLSPDLEEGSPSRSDRADNEPESLPPGLEEASLVTEAEALDASQVADDWLFHQTFTLEQDGAATLAPLDSPAADPPEIVEDAIPANTMQALFGDSVELSEGVAKPAEETIASLSDLLPDEQPPDTVEEFPNDVPDDVYIAASANEDLINLAESASEQRLLIDFDDEQLVERLDEDLQKLAGDTFSTDYGVEEDALDPLDQTALETIVKELNLEDLDLDDGLSNAASLSESSADTSSQIDEANADFDLFEGFSTDTASIDNPSAEDELLADAATAAQPLTDEGSQELDFLGLAADPLVDELDDELTDSLENELGDLSEQSDTLSQDLTETMVGQPLSDLEAPVVAEDDAMAFPTVDDTEPRLDSAAVPDVPPDLLIDDGLSNVSPEADDFLQAEQQAFWQAIADDSSQVVAPESAELTETSDAESAALLEISDASEAALEPLLLDSNEEQNLDNLLGLGTLSPSVPRPETEDEIDFGDLDELFGKSSPPELADLEQTEPADSEAAQTIDSLADLEFELEAVTSPEALIPQPDGPAAMAATAVAPESAESPIDTRSAEAIIASGADDGATLPPTVATAQGDWFLGLDVGSTGLSAVIMDRRTGQVYPLYWQTATDSAKHFRLPATAVMTSTQETVAVGYDAMANLGGLGNESGAKAPELVGVNRLKPLLKVAVGHGQTLANSDPWLRWSDTVELPMLQVLQAMVALLKHMVSQGQAVGLEQEQLQQLWENLQGVVVGYPTNWPDTYSFNLREAVLAAGLINQPGKVLFVEDAIATVLSGLPDPETLSVPETVSLSRQPSLYNCQWQDSTIVISGGAVMTELGLVNLPKNLANLNYADFALRGFAYAGDALDQDIVCQLLLPAERRQPLGGTERTWDWQGYLSPEDANWEELQLDTLTLPTVGHVDWVQRYHLQQRLQASSLGQSLLAAARHLKLALQQRNQIHISLAGQQWLIKRRYLESLIFLPYIQRISRYLNVLLGHHAVDAQAIKQVVCTGGSASLPAIARWLRQKFPNATIIQDTYATELPQSCSRVAYGLVNLARYFQVLNVTRQQYSDYFLLMELLRVFPQQPLPVGAIMHLLEQRGVNTQACHQHILALLEGHLPPGLVPTAADRGLISDRTTDLATYRALLKTPLFSKTVTESGGVIYTPNEAPAEQLRAYFNRILIGKAQTLEEPLIAQLEALV